MSAETSPPLSLAQGRLCIVLAALLWSTSGMFTKLLTQDTFLGLNQPDLQSLAVGDYCLPVQIAFYRPLFASMVLALTLRRQDFSCHRLMLVGAGCFAAMNATFLTAVALGTAANAILLQYTAPLWVYLAGTWWLGEKPDRRSTISLVAGLCGIGVIVGGGYNAAELPILGGALASGLAFAGVILCLRALRQLSPRWLTLWNHLGSALVVLPLVLPLPPPSWPQLGVQILFGVLQMGLPYWLLARGLRVVSAQEAGAITLLEPILMPVWAYLVSPATEAPQAATFVGGAIILAALAYRYWPGPAPVTSGRS